MNHIGIDLGTFHTVAVSCEEHQLIFPSRSIPSIAFKLGNATIVGVDAESQIDLAQQLLIAPKLKLHDKSVAPEFISSVLRKLVEQATIDLGVSGRNAVMTVPPSWTLSDCLAIKQSVSALGLELNFLHEPVALLIAVMQLTRKRGCDPFVAGLLTTAKRVLVCDWGAGTVDLALVQINQSSDVIEFRCLGETTVLGHGGTNIAQDVVGSFVTDSTTMVRDKEAFKLQKYWQGDALATFNSDKYSRDTTLRRNSAAVAIASAASDLLNRLCIDDRSDIVTLLYGGPVESVELRSSLISELEVAAGTNREIVCFAGSEFVRTVENSRPLRRDVLVAAGASIYSANGEALPEFEYEIVLRDSFGKPTSTIRLIKGRNLAGIQVVTPPFTGVDYYVDVSQISITGNMRNKTAISAELKLFVRKNAVVMYRIAEAGVGFAKIEASEAQDLPAPENFSDSRIEAVILPEKSTRFNVRYVN